MQILAIKVKEIFNDDIEIDESCFGSVRKGKTGKATGKESVFCILKRHGKIPIALVKKILQQE